MGKYGFTLLFITFLLGACENDPDPDEKLFGAYSIFVAQGKVCISGYSNVNEVRSTVYWIEDLKTEKDDFIDALNNGSLFRKAVDEEFRTGFVYKNSSGNIDEYRFDQGSLIEQGKIHYYKNDIMITPDITSVGSISAVYISGNIEFFTGYLGQIIMSEGGESLSPEFPFYLNSLSDLIKLPIPEEYNFLGVTSIYLSDNNEIYVSGQLGVPMYWVNEEPVILNNKYGIVFQLQVIGGDVYAVGYYNKNNSNSTGHTACYWKNGELIELEDNAQANGIFIDGNDVFVAGSVGRVPLDYTACYWKNGIRIDLP